MGKNVVDVGCGTAVLAMAAAKIWPDTVLASDIDEVATDTASANVSCNDLEGRVNVVTCAGFEHPVLRETAPFDLIPREYSEGAADCVVYRYGALLFGGRICYPVRYFERTGR